MLKKKKSFKRRLEGSTKKGQQLLLWVAGLQVSVILKFPTHSFSHLLSNNVPVTVGGGGGGGEQLQPKH